MSPVIPPAPNPEESAASRGLRAGQTVGAGRFTLVEPLGEGGMGVVWKAADSTLGGMVALKFLPQEISADPIAIEDLRRETAQTRRLSHPNIVRVYDLYEDVLPFIFMEFVEGHTLSHERVRHPRRVLPWTFLAPYIGQLCGALEYAHREHVIHRDLKPSNILIDLLRDQIKLVDFGIARAVSESVTRVTQKRPGDGTLVYMSCQQLNGEQASPSDDIYSLGVTLYELLTSKPPFHSGDTAWQIRYGEITPLSQRLADFELENTVPPPVEEAIMACLARDPFKRPASARDAAEALGLAEPRPKSSRRHPSHDSQGLADDGAGRPPASPTPPRRSPVVPAAPGESGEPTPMPARPSVPTELPPAALPERPPRPAGPRLAKGVFLFLLFLGALAAALYYIRIDRVPLYEVLLARLDLRLPGETGRPSAASLPASIPTAPAAPDAAATQAVVAAIPQAGASNAPLEAVAPAPQAAVNPVPEEPQVALPSQPPPVTEEPTVIYPRLSSPWTNSLGMRFMPVPGTRTLFAVWETRLLDYQRFLEAVRSNRAFVLRPPPFQQSSPQEPVVRVSWSNAVAFCRWLTDLERGAGQLGARQVYRLPTDREWSLAVGLTNEPGKTLAERIAASRFDDQYPWGNQWPPPKAAGNFRGTETRLPTAIDRYSDEAPYTAPVGRGRLSPLGLADLSGNVWEWCEQEPRETLRVARGGAWDTSDRRELRSAHRYLLTPGTELESLGFRCVLDVGEDSP